MTFNPNYMVQIKHHSAPAGENTVIAAMPEQFDLRIQSDWEPALANMVENVLGGANAIGRSVAGLSISDKLLTAQIWRNSDPIDFNLTLLFDAKTDAKKDVTDNVRRLIGWSLPSRENLVIKAPGPTIMDVLSGDYNKGRISLRIGRMLYIDSVIIPTMDVTWYTASDTPGQYIAADVNISLRTFFTPDSVDVLQYFQLGSTVNLDDSVRPPLNVVPSAGDRVFAAARALGLGGGQREPSVPE